MGVAMNVSPPLPRDRFLTKYFHAIGFTRDWTFDPRRLTRRQTLALEYAAEDAELLLEKIGELSPPTNDWLRVPAMVGTFGVHYLVRAVTAKAGLGALPGVEASYVTTNVDADGASLDGSGRYELRFPKGGFPPVEAFCSVTLYDQHTNFLVNNSFQPKPRYSIGDRTPGTVLGQDGSLTVQIQNTVPAEGQANWLPAPTGKFSLSLRLYWPKPEFLDGTYQIPRVVRVQ